MSLTMIMGQSTTFNEDIKAYYHAPLKEYDFEKKIKESNYTANLDSLKKAFELATKRVKPKDEFEADSINDTIYYKQTGRMFFCKDGTSDAYVKRGLDYDLDSIEIEIDCYKKIPGSHIYRFCCRWQDFHRCRRVDNY